MTSQLKTYFVGNSVTDTINQAGLDALAESNGDDLLWGRHMIPGAPLSWIWDHPNDGFQQQPYGYYPNALDNYQWDVLSLQPFDRPILWSYEGNEQGDLLMASNFISRAQQNSPDLQVYLYQRWPRKPDSSATPTAEDWNRLWQATYGADTDWSNNESRSYFERLQTRLQAAFPTLKPIEIVPVGDVFFALNQKMQSGQVPGYSSIWDLYYDHIHLNNVGSFIVGSTYYATLYGADLAALPIPAQYQPTTPSRDRPISSALEALIEQTIQQVVGIAPPPLPTITIAAGTALEGRDATVAIPVTLSAASPQPVTVNYSTSDGTAQAGSDYQATSGSLTFAPGQTTQTIALSILNDDLPEADETVILTLSNPSNGRILQREAIVTLTDTLQSAVSTTLPTGIDSLLLTGNANLNGIGNAANNRLTGNTGNNRLLGREGRDLLIGEAGADRLLGGAGDDALTGGLNLDRFVFNGDSPFTSAALGLDTLTDFTPGIDRIGLSKTTFTRLQSGVGRGFQVSGEFAVVDSDQAAATRSALIVYSSSGSLFYNENGDAAGFGNGGKFAILQGSPAIGQRDFMIQG